MNKLKQKIRIYLNNRKKANYSLGPANNLDYWNEVIKYFKKRFEYNPETFVCDPIVAWHICSEDYFLSRRLLKSLGKYKLDQIYARSQIFKIFGEVEKLSDLRTTELSQLHAYFYIKSLIKSDRRDWIEFGIGTGTFLNVLAQFTSTQDTYTGIDFPELIDINKFYIQKMPPNLGQVNLIELEKLALQTKKNKKLFYSHFALSEVPISERSLIVEKYVKDCDEIFVFFQDNFQSIDNLKYFTDLMMELRAVGFRSHIEEYSVYNSSTHLLIAQK